MQGYVTTPDGPLPLSEGFELGAPWTPFRFRTVGFEARLAYPPILLLDKPEGAVTSRAAANGAPTVFDLLPPELAARVEPVGRLDRETSGLLLLTGDGRIIQHLTHPRRETPRTYLAELVGPPNPTVIEGLRRGEVALRDGHQPRPAELAPVGSTGGPDAPEGVPGEPLCWRVTLTEGKYHEVRRLFAAAGTRVTGLRRIRFAHLRIEALEGADGDRDPLPARWVRLEEAEVEALYERIGLALPPREVEVRVEGTDGSPEG